MRAAWWVISVIFIVVISLFAWRMALRPAQNTDAINQAIIGIARAATVAEREVALTDALSMLSKLEAEKHPTMGNGMFYIALGDVYHAFGALPWAVWGYKQGQSLAPSHPGIDSRLATIREELQLPPREVSSVFNQLIFFHHLSLPRRLQLFFLTAFLGFSFGSVAIWQSNRLWKSSACVFGVVALVLLGSSLYTRYVEPTEAVVIQGSLLATTPSEGAGVVGDQPVSSGSTAYVLGVENKGQWLRILTEQGEVGYLPTERVRLIY